MNAIIAIANTHHVFKTHLLSPNAPACHGHAAEGQVSTLRLGSAGGDGEHGATKWEIGKHDEVSHFRQVFGKDCLITQRVMEGGFGKEGFRKLLRLECKG